MGKAGIRFVLGVWLFAMTLEIRNWIQSNPGTWPKPAILLKTTVAFSALGLVSEIQPDIAGALAVGLAIALLLVNPKLLSSSTG